MRPSSTESLSLEDQYDLLESGQPLIMVLLQKAGQALIMVLMSFERLLFVSRQNLNKHKLEGIWMGSRKHEGGRIHDIPMKGMIQILGIFTRQKKKHLP